VSRRIADLRTHEERVAATETARRNARYTYAERRIKAIVEAAPPLTAEQLDKLATILRSVVS
jgi:hypothetical protein